MTLHPTLVLSPMEQVGPLSRAQAVALVDQIKGHLADLKRLLERAYAGRAWIPLGYSSWDEMCLAEFAPHMPRLKPPARAEHVAHLTNAGLSQRAIAAGLGMSQDTVRRGIKEAQAEGLLVERDTTVGKDGRTYTTRPKVSERKRAVTEPKARRQLTPAQREARTDRTALTKAITAATHLATHPTRVVKNASPKHTSDRLREAAHHLTQTANRMDTT